MAEEVEDGEEGDGKKKVSGKKLIILIVLPILILGGAGAGAFLTGLLDPLLGIEEPVAEGEAGADGEAAVVEGPAVPGHYFEVDEMLVSLRSTGKRQRILKLKITLELKAAADAPTIEGFIPKIIDNFQVFLRELRVEELEGSQGLYRIKEEMLARVNTAVHPMKIKDVLISDMTVQ